MQERITELIKDTVSDATEVAHRESKALKQEAEEWLAASAVGSGLIAAGAMVSIFGAGLLLSAPVLPARQRWIRWRMFGLAGMYVAGGSAASLFGGRLLRGVLRQSAGRARSDLEQARDAARDQLRQQAPS